VGWFTFSQKQTHQVVENTRECSETRQNNPKESAGINRLGVGAAKLVAIPVGESPTDRRGPVTVVVISSREKGDRLVESLDVKAPGGRERSRSDPSGGASNRTGRSNGEPISPEIRFLLETDGRIKGRAEPLLLAKAHDGTDQLDKTRFRISSGT